MTEYTLQNKAIKEVGELMLVGFRVLCPDDQYIIELPKTSLPLNKRISEIKHVKNPLQQVGAFVVEHEFGEEIFHMIHTNNPTSKICNFKT